MRDASPGCALRCSLPSAADCSASRNQDRRFRTSTIVCRTIALVEPADVVLTKANIYRTPICFCETIFVVRPKAKLTDAVHKQCWRQELHVDVTCPPFPPKTSETPGICAACKQNRRSEESTMTDNLI